MVSPEVRDLQFFLLQHQMGPDELQRVMENLIPMIPPRVSQAREENMRFLMLLTVLILFGPQSLPTSEITYTEIYLVDLLNLDPEEQEPALDPAGDKLPEELPRIHQVPGHMPAFFQGIPLRMVLTGLMLSAYSDTGHEQETWKRAKITH